MAKTYSGGMRRRLDLAASLVGRPSVIFLDEPTTGLDPAKREDMWDVVRRLVSDGSTVLLTTQYLDEADALADEITVIDHGQVIANDTPDGLKRVVGGQRHRGQARPTWPAWTTSAASCATISRHEPRRPAADASSTVPVNGRGRPAARPSARLGAAGISVTELSLHLPSLDEVFMTLTGKPTDDSKERGGRMTTATTRTHRPPEHAHPSPPRQSRAAEQSRPCSRFRARDLVLAKRSLIKTYRTPEALIDVTLQPIIFLRDVHLHLRWGDRRGSQENYLQFLLPGLLGQIDRDGRRRPRART